MFLLIIAAVLLLPVGEVAAAMWIATYLGWDSTLFLLCSASLLGWGVLVLSAKASVKTATIDLMRARGSVGRAVAGRAVSSIAAILLLLPGFITGAMGLILLFPPVHSAISRRLVGGVIGAVSNPVTNQRPVGDARDVIEVDIVDVEPAPTQTRSSGQSELG